jgi:hypothetical protein
MPEFSPAGELTADGGAAAGWERPSALLVAAEAAPALSASDCAVALVPVATPPE